MRVLAAIIDRQLEYHIEDVLVPGQVVTFPEEDVKDRHVVSAVNRDETIIILRTYVPVTGRSSAANDTFRVFEYRIVGEGDDAQIMVSDEASIAFPVSPSSGKAE